MYRVEFYKPERGLLKPFGFKERLAIKSRKGHSLHQAEEYMTRMAVAAEENLTVNLHLTDQDTGTIYECERIELLAGQPVSLLPLLVSNIMEEPDALGGDGEAEEILSALKAQYDGEQDSQAHTPQNHDFDELDEVNSEPQIEDMDFSGDEPTKVIWRPDRAEQYQQPEPEPEYQPEPERSQAIFPALAEYLTLDDVEGFITRCQQRIEPEHLLEYLYISVSDDVSELEVRKRELALQLLQGPEFVRLRDELYHTAADLRDKAQRVLTGAYNKAMDMEYEALAEDELDEDIRRIRQETDKKIRAYTTEADGAAAARLRAFDAQQSQELEIFKQQQAAAREKTVHELMEQRDSRSKVYEDTETEKLDERLRQLVQEKAAELTAVSRDQLTETRHQAIRQLEKEIESLVGQINEQTYSLLDDVRAEINGRQATILADLEERRRAESHQLKKEEMELTNIKKQEEIKMEKEFMEQQIKTNAEIASNAARDERRLQEIDQLKYTFQDSINTLGSQLNETLAQSVAQQRRSLRNAVGGIVAGIAVAALVAGGFLLQNHYLSSLYETRITSLQATYEADMDAIQLELETSLEEYELTLNEQLETIAQYEDTVQMLQEDLNAEQSGREQDREDFKQTLEAIEEALKVDLTQKDLAGDWLD